MNSMDLVIEIYKPDVDQTLLDECLKRTVEERIRALEEFEQFREELQAGMKARIDQVRRDIKIARGRTRGVHPSRRRSRGSSSITQVDADNQPGLAGPTRRNHRRRQV